METVIRSKRNGRRWYVSPNDMKLSLHCVRSKYLYIPRYEYLVAVISSYSILNIHEKLSQKQVISPHPGCCVSIRSINDLLMITSAQ